jgi:Na+-transporting methylmalonyl-CoA/oxaloacetate decarboxylase gamma subunit
MLSQFRSGLKSFYAAEILMLVASLLTTIPMAILSAIVNYMIGINYSAFEKDYANTLNAIGFGIVLIILTLLCYAVGYIAPIVAHLVFAIGAGKSSKHEESFRVPCYLYIACVVLSTAAIIMALSSIEPTTLWNSLTNNRVVSNLLVIILLMVFAYIAEFLGMIYWFGGMRAAVEKLNRADLAELCMKRRTRVIVLFAVSSVFQVINTVQLLSGSTSVLMALIGIVAAVILHTQMMSFIKTIQNAAAFAENIEPAA